MQIQIQKIAVIAVMIVLFAILSDPESSAQAPQRVGPRSHPEQHDTWRTFTTNDGGFSISMPGVPRHTTKPNSTEKYSVDLQNHDVQFHAIYVKLPRNIIDPETIKQGLRLMADGELRVQRTSAETDKAISYKGYAGKEVTFRSPNRGGGWCSGDLRFYIVNDRAYELITMRCNGKGNIEDIQRFFRSFQLLNSKEVCMAEKGPEKKSTPLWMYGFLCFVGATVATQIDGPPQNRSEALGQGVGSLVLVLVGIMLIIAHFLRRKR